MMAYMFTEIIRRLNGKLNAVQLSNPGFPSKPLFFEDISSKTTCFPKLSSFSTLDGTTEALAQEVAANKVGPFSPSFAPYKCSLNTKWCKFNGKKYKGINSMDHKYYANPI